MCWSGEASAVLATVGLGSTAYVAYKGEDRGLWMPLGYFALMEMLQAFTYAKIDQCSDPWNQIFTLFGYLHIAFQPFFINMVAMHFAGKAVQEKLAPLVYTVCFIGSILMLIKMYPFSWAGTCHTGPYGPLCSEILCSTHGSWHIAWNIPLNNIAVIGYVGYGFPAFILPLLYGSWRFTIYQIIAGPLLARMTTNNMNEWPAVWCLFSIALLLAVIKTPVRKHLYVNRS